MVAEINNSGHPTCEDCLFCLARIADVRQASKESRLAIQGNLKVLDSLSERLAEEVKVNKNRRAALIDFIEAGLEFGPGLSDDEALEMIRSILRSNGLIGASRPTTEDDTT
ncbi:MAG: hypothetical protein QOG10_1306 [Kribbellaceae bacterium]|jgi:hypothetical protein|nr:hypothetical protein [Kribbellaceae bacterium]